MKKPAGAGGRGAYTDYFLPELLAGWQTTVTLGCIGAITKTCPTGVNADVVAGLD